MFKRIFLNKRFSTPTLVKTIYFMIYAAMAFLTAYGAIYFSDCGLNGRQIGALGSLACLVGMLVQPFWGGLADRTLKTGRILFFLSTVGGGIGLLFAFNHGFWAFFILTCLGSLFPAMASGGPLLDSYTFHHLGKADRNLYAQYRIWGTYSYFLVSLVAGFLLARTGIRSMFFFVTGITWIVGLFCLQLEDIGPEEQDLEHSGPHFKGVRELLGHRPFLLFLSCFFLASLADSCVWQFLSLYLQTIGTPRSLISWAGALGIPLEVVVFVLAPKILKHWGAPRMIQLGLVAVALRWTLLYFFPVPWVAMGVQLLQGVAFAGTFLGSTTLVDITVPATLKATGQSVFAACGGLAGIAGGLLGGWLFDTIGVQNLCLVSGILGAISLGLFIRFSGDMEGKPQQG
jgi:PPP family 3-phenylpropionic acid transporter